MKHEILLESEVPDEGLTPFIETAIAVSLAEEKVEFPCEINILLTDDEGIREINKEYRGIDKETDVLSFPAYEFEAGSPPSDPQFLDPDSGLLALGDMVISVPRAKAQGEEFGQSLETEVVYLTIHSVLHLLGYDHLDESREKAKMRAREKEILASYGKEKRG